MNQPIHSISAVSKRLGLSPHLIRVWEKRYGAVEPIRTATNRRLYSEAEMERLALLKRATLAGHRISQVARLSTGELRTLVVPSAPGVPPRELGTPGASGSTDWVGECLEATRRFDAPRFEEGLRKASLELGSQGLLHKVVGPLACEIGDLWARGEISAAHEHFASAVIRVFLGGLCRPYALPETAPVLVVATPSGQLHELGAVLVAAAASSHGWRVMYLGVSLPAAEIGGVAIRSHARAVALSLVYPNDDPALPAELENLRRYLPTEIGILVGGRAAEAYAEVLDRIGAKRPCGLAGLYTTLDTIQSVGASH